MTRAYGYLCYGGVELSNEDRARSYITDGLLGAQFRPFSGCSPCAALDDGYSEYVSPIADGIWYDDSIPASAEFFGIMPGRIEVLTSLSRQVTRSVNGGGVLSPVTLSPRILTFTGTMLATSLAGMQYGSSWVQEVLSGSSCSFGCSGDDVTYLPACPDEDYDPNLAFRKLIDCGIVDGPVFSPVDSDIPECYLTQVSFQIASSSGYRFGIGETLLDEELSTTLAASYETAQWRNGGVVVIDLTNNGSVDATDIVVEGRISLDGSCPVTGDAASVAPSWTYTIPTIAPGDRLIIDGLRRRARYYDASCQQEVSGLPYIDFSGPWKAPEIGPCTTMCVELSIDAGTVDVNMTGHLREV